MSGAAVEVEQLVVRYGDVTAVDGVSFAAEPGRVLALLGPNGAGKTSTVETLEGYRHAAAGRVRVLGLDPAADHRELVRNIGVMLQGGGLYPAMTPAAILRLFASYYTDPIDQETLTARLGLTAVSSTKCRRLSGGEQQRLALALALVGRPRVVFLDEPTAGIDPEGRLVVREVISELRGDGVAVVLTSHELEEVERVADDIVVLHRGRVAIAGTAESLRRRADVAVRFRTAAGIDVEAMSAAVGAPISERRPGEYVAAAEPSPALVARTTAWLAENGHVVHDLRTGSSLEDVFMEVISEEGA